MMSKLRILRVRWTAERHLPLRSFPVVAPSDGVKQGADIDAVLHVRFYSGSTQAWQKGSTDILDLFIVPAALLKYPTKFLRKYTYRKILGR